MGDSDDLIIGESDIFNVLSDLTLWTDKRDNKVLTVDCSISLNSDWLIDKSGKTDEYLAVSLARRLRINCSS
jgi:hypothetical protein